MTNITGDPNDGLYFDFVSTLYLTANADLDGLRIECLGSAEAGTETNSTILRISGMLRNLLLFNYTGYKSFAHVLDTKIFCMLYWMYLDMQYGWTNKHIPCVS